MAPVIVNPTKSEEDEDTTTILQKFRNDPYHYENGGKCFYNPNPLPPTNHNHGEIPQMDLYRPEEGTFDEMMMNNCGGLMALNYCQNDESYPQEAASLGGHRTFPHPPRAGPLLPEYEDYENTNEEPTQPTDAVDPNNQEDNFHASALTGKVTYVPYPVEEFYCPPPTLPREEMTRLFIGQLPYDVTDMQLQWLCYTFGNGAIVHYPERIMKKREPHYTHRGVLPPPPPPQYGGVIMNDRDRSACSGGGAPRVSTGCIHVYCHPEDAAALMEGMHKRVLVDDNGVWYAAAVDGEGEEDELFHLNAHIASMKANKNLRPINRPFDTVVAQTAVSTYVPRPPSYNTTKKMVKGGQAELR